MKRNLDNRGLLRLATLLFVASALFVGCAEESKPLGDSTSNSAAALEEAPISTEQYKVPELKLGQALPSVSSNQAALDMRRFDRTAHGVSASVLALQADAHVDLAGVLKISSTPAWNPRGQKVQGWSYEMKLSGIGRDSLRVPEQSYAPRLSKGTLSLRGQQFELRYEHRPEGLEQLIEIFEAPTGEGTLTLQFDTPIGWEHQVLEGGRDVAVLEKGQIRFHWRQLIVVDAKGRELPARMQAEKGKLSYIIDDNGAQYPILVDPLATSPDWTSYSSQAGSFFGSHLSEAGDVNGDGYNDLLVGQATYSNGQTQEGRTLLFLGNSSGLSATASWAVESDQAYALMGPVASIGDINKDGFDDVVVGAPVYSTGTYGGLEGAVWLYLGSAAGLSASSAWDAEGSNYWLNFGTTIDGLGDVNGDTYPDLVVGEDYWSADGWPPFYGRVHIFYGASSGYFDVASTTIDGFMEGFAEDPGARFGQAVAGAGDLNGDGYDDLAVGAPQAKDTSNITRGSVAVYYGSSSGFATNQAVDWHYWGAGNSASGWSLDGAGDTNGDGYDELLVGAYKTSFSGELRGSAMVFAGSETGLSYSPSWQSYGEVLDAQHGYDVAGGCDINNDGFDDVIVSAISHDGDITNEGKVQLFLGTASGITAEAVWETTSGSEGAKLGYALTCDDFNSDGFADLVVGATLADDPITPLDNTGAVYAYLGSANCFIDGEFFNEDEVNPNNPCQICSTADDRSNWTNRSNGSSCDDNDLCTVGQDTCFNGVCEGTPMDCSDGLSCTADLCSAGVCSNPVSSGCLIDGQCYVDSAINPDNSCQQCTNSLATESWSSVAAGVLCDTEYCSQGQTCDGAGTCSGGTPRDCNSACGVGICNETTDACEATAANQPDGTACDDGDPCTDGQDTCLSGICVGSEMDCTSLDSECTIGVCSLGSCESQNRPTGSACSDGDACTLGDTCSAGVCVSGSPMACNDGRGCTDDYCVAGSCQFTVSSGCLIDGSCITEGAEDPNHQCMQCNPIQDTSGWSPKPSGVTCDDGSFCNQNETCDGAGNCSGGAVLNCDTDCQYGACSEFTQNCYVDSDKADGTLCDDGDPCTPGSDSCQSGLCTGATMDCGEYVCQAGSCLISCADDSACAAGSYCTTSGECTSANMPPTAEAGSDQHGSTSNVITLDGRASQDPEGVSLNFSWAQVSGPSASLSEALSPTPTFIPNVIGTYVFELTVDDGVFQRTDSCAVFVDNGANTPPIAVITGDLTAAEGDTILLSATTSSDADGDPLTYRWSLTSGTPSPTLVGLDSSQLAVSFPTGLSADTAYTFLLVVNDGQSNSIADQHQVEVLIPRIPSAPTIATPAEGIIIGDQTPSFSGTALSAELGSIAIYNSSNDALLCTGLISSSSDWSCSSSSALGDGIQSVYAISTNIEGNPSSPTPDRTFTIDTSIPSAPVIVTPTDSAQLAVAEVTVTGTAPVDHSVILREATGAFSDLTCSSGSSGDFTCTLGTLADGGYIVYAIAQNSLGAVSAPSVQVTFTVDTLAPNAPIFSRPLAGAILGETQPTFEGSAASALGGEVTVFLTESTPLCTATINAAGLWSCQSSLALLDGPTSVFAQAIDAAGNASAYSEVRSFDVDTSIPTTPVIENPATDSYLTNSEITVSGTAAPDNIVEVVVVGEFSVGCLADTLGVFECDLGSMDDGNYSVYAIATTPAGASSSPSLQVRFTVDTIAPLRPTIEQPIEGAILGDTQPEISGTAPGAVDGLLAVATQDGTPICLTEIAADDSWTCRSEYVFSDGTFSIQAQATDPAGNSATSALRTFTIDTSIPTSPVIDSPVDGSFLAISSLLIEGQAPALATVTITFVASVLDDISCQTSDTGTFSCDAGDLEDGEYRIYAIATNELGFDSAPSLQHDFIIDTVLPAAPIFERPAAGTTIGDTEPEFEGSVDEADGGFVTVYSADIELCSGAVDEGSWRCTSELSLDNGEVSVEAIAFDPATNASPASETLTFTIDNGIPSTPRLLSPEDEEYLDESYVVISGEAGANVNLEVVFVDSDIEPITCSADSGGNFECDAGELDDGRYQVYAIATNAVGVNSSPSTQIIFYVDTEVPSSPLFSYPEEEATLGDSLPYFAGTTENLEMGLVQVAFEEGGEVLCEDLVEDGSNWRCQSTVELSSGTYQVVARATDPAGNASTWSAPLSFSIDTSIPSTPVINSPQNDEVLAGESVDFSGTAAAANIVTLLTFTGDELCSTTTDELGYFDCNAELEFGFWTVYAVAANSLGESSSPSVPTTFTLVECLEDDQCEDGVCSDNTCQAPEEADSTEAEDTLEDDITLEGSSSSSDDCSCQVRSGEQRSLPGMLAIVLFGLFFALRRRKR